MGAISTASPGWESRSNRWAPLFVANVAQLLKRRNMDGPIKSPADAGSRSNRYARQVETEEESRYRDRPY
jgi:hypothetical protein